MFTDIVWRFLILATFVYGALGNPSCPRVHRQEQFCTSDLVLKMRVDGVINVTRGHRYRMKLLTAFRGDRKQLKLVDNPYLYLSTEISLRRNIYVVFGRYKNGRIYADGCQKMMEWESGDTFYRNALTNLYKTGCNCIDEIGHYRRDKICYWHFSYMKKVDKNCKWVENDYFKRCQGLSHGK